MADTYAKDSQTLFLSQIPLDLQQPHAELLSWRAAAVRYLASLLADANRTEQAAEKEKPGSLTAQRLTAIAQALRANQKALVALLKPLLDHAAIAQAPASLTGSINHSASHFQSNFANVFRDWAWPNETASNEVEAHRATVLKLLEEGSSGNALKPKRVLVLGAGSARLAYDLACDLKEAEIVATEINPLLFLIAERLMTGHCLELFEIAELPEAPERAAVKRTLALPTDRVLQSKLTLVLNDFTEDRLKDSDFDVVITPWFIDVVGLPFKTTAAKVSRLLKTNGSWVNLGPLMFLTSERASLLTQAEIVERLQSQESGFELATTQGISLTQLKSDLSATYRTDRVFGWTAQKRAPCQWPLETRERESVHAPETVQALLPDVDLEEVAQSHALLSDILMGCHRGETLAQIAQRLAPDFGLPALAVEPIVRGVLENFLRSQRA